jgi:hypothetical protein
MNRKHYFQASYVYFLTSLLVLAFAVEWLSLPASAARIQDLASSAAIYLLMYLLLRTTYCVLTERDVVRASYLVFKTRIDIADISAIEFPGTWLSDEMRTLAIVGKSGRMVKMSEMAYGREALADVARHLLQLNANIKLDEASARLLAKV